jgi:AcrR family transcriptional regulator
VPKVSDEHLAARREQILDGARRAFSRWGYDGATVARLEEETGLSRGAIFNYFANKKALFVELAWSESSRYKALLVERGVDETIRTMAQESPEWLGVVIEVESRLRHDEEFLELMEARAANDVEREALIEWLREQQAGGKIRDDVDALDIGRFLTMVLNGLAIRVAGGDETNVEPVVRLVRDSLKPRQ